jgi:hypothetical protein
MSAFWKSPVGKKMIELMPMLTQETYSVLQQNGLTRLPAFQKTVDARLRQAGIVVPGPPQP